MDFMVKKLTLPLLIATISAGLALGWQHYSQTSDFRTLIIGCAIFCVFMALWNHFQLSLQTDRAQRRMAAIFGLEDNLLRRIQDIETTRDNLDVISSLAERVEQLELVITSRDAADDKDVAPEIIDGENVVMLKAQREPSERIAAAEQSDRRQTRARIRRCLDDNALRVRMQPIIDLLSKKVVAVEAFGFLESDGEVKPAEDWLEHFTDEQRCQFDLAMLGILARAARRMEEDGQALPVQYSMVSIGVPRHNRWENIVKKIRADVRLARVLTPQVSMAGFNRLTEDQISRFLELKEYGLKPAITDCVGIEACKRLVASKHFERLKIPVDELLRYTARESERVADILLPELAKNGIEVTATHIEKAHQAANLIDLDTRFGQGNFVSPARDIQLEPRMGVGRASAT